MQTALTIARQALPHEIPVGAVIVRNGEMITHAHNRCIADHDPTAHAEIVAIRQAAKILGNYRLTDCDLYVTLEPCAMCAAAIAHARIRRLYFGAYDPKSGGVEHGARIFQQATCHHRPEIIGGLEEHTASQLLKEFFATKI